jgi:mannosyl-oligosaccharide glucosidase
LTRSSGVKDAYFLRDEGFHLLHIGAWDNDFRCSVPYACNEIYDDFLPLSLEILKSWIDLIDEDGWVAREQILGEEARSKVS